MAASGELAQNALSFGQGRRQRREAGGDLHRPRNLKPFPA